MKPFKTAICCLWAAVVSASLFCSAGGYAFGATARYVRADAKDVYFCERKDLSYALFAIPYTYCAEVLSADGEWYYVRYAADKPPYRALYGYCRSENLTPLDEPPENTYLDMPVTVAFRADAPTGGSLPVLNELNVTAAFYGVYYSGATAYSYVLYDGKFGYVYGANDDYPLNELPTPPPPDEVKSDGGANTKLITVLALTGAAAVALVILYLTGRKRCFKP